MTRYLLAGLVLLLGARASAAVSLLNIVDEQCPIVLSVRDVPTLVKNWNQSPWSKTWNDDQVKKFLAPLRAQMKVDHWDEACKAETGYTVTELVAMARGQVVLALTSADLPVGEQDPDPSRFPLLLAVDLGGEAPKVAKIIVDNDEKEHEAVRTEDFAGVKLHLYQKSAEQSGDVLVWAMVDGVWLLGPSKATVEQAIDNVQKGRAATPFGESERYLKIRKEDPEANVMLSVNLQALYPVIKQLSEKKAAASATQPGAMAPGAVLEAFGLDCLRDLYFTADVGETSTQLSGGLTYSDLKGLFRLLAYRDGPVAQPDFVSSKWVTVSSVQYDVQGAYAGAKDFLTALNPIFGGMLQAQIKNLNQQLGVDLERDLVGSLGGNIVACSAMRPGASPDSPSALDDFDQIYAISMQNAPAFTRAVEALKGMMGPQADKLFVKREYLGQNIYSYAGPAQGSGQKGFSYAVTPKYLFVSVGSPAVIETALQDLDGKQPTIWQRPEVQAALADMPSNACAFQFQDNRAMVGSLLETLIKVAPAFANRSHAVRVDSRGGGDAAGGDPENNSGPFDLSAKPDAADVAKYWSVSTGYAWHDDHGLYFHSKINHVK